ncbi:pilus assembly protein TadG-related protein [uncultured Arthrobacter sp.]|uniref:pilus assembly protein TadG-related protein n=1 Tax=uncultured Arthrobacter sp. TaxID=114050 RepID=UPI0026310B42|nr:TadE/TadG family type IV pilus assembly protein [uncultured Arthrobacter sp.]
MRWIAKEDDERGAVAVIVAILLVVLLGFAALAVDVGLLYAEKAQLRNGADAAAIGIAQSCAEDILDSENCSDLVDESSLAKQMADANSLDNQSNAESVALDTTAGTVSVRTGALETGSTPNSVSLFFAQALGFDEAEVSVSSNAAWGVPVGGVAPFAIAFSQCEVDAGISGDGSLQFLTVHGKNSECTSTSSGQEIPGGFGWLDQSSGYSCGVVIDPSSPWIGSDPGNNVKDGCAARLGEWEDRLRANESVIELIPIFDDTKGNGGQTGAFQMHAFAAFDIRGWSFPGGGNEYMTPDAAKYYKDNKLNSNNRGFIGRFVEFVSLDSSFQIKPMPGGGYGAQVVKLTLGETP